MSSLPPFPSTPAANELPTPPRALLRGTMVDRFEILRVIADAASNIEYVALDHTERIEVVLKEYMPQRLGRRKVNLLRPLTPASAVALSLGLRSFIDEGRLLAGIDHPCLVRVLNVIEANGTAYMVMPLYDGLRLQHARQAMSVPPDERLLRPLIDGLLDALSAMHQQGVLHGAVGPNNILLLSDERAVLLGPDLARHVIADDLVESLMTAVEPSFEAPEQLVPAPSKPLGPWTDLYSLAETLRFCIGGELRTPHVAASERRETMAQMVRRLFGDPPTAVYSTALLETMDVALEPRASARPQSTGRFRELLGALAPAIDDEPTRLPSAAFQSNTTADPRQGSPAAAPASGRIEPAFDADRSISAAALASTRRRSAKGPLVGWGMALVVIAVTAALAGGWRMGWWSVGPDGVRVAMPTLTAPGAKTSESASPNASKPMSTPAVPIAATAPDAIAPANTASTSEGSPPLPETARPLAPVPAPSPAPETSNVAAAPVAPPPAVVATAPGRAPATAVERSARATLAGPRDACEGRTQFSLYRCMQAQCERSMWQHHPQCELMRTTDKVPP